MKIVLISYATIRMNTVTEKRIWWSYGYGLENIFIQQKLTGCHVLANVCAELMKRLSVMHYKCLIRQKWKSPFY